MIVKTSQIALPKEACEAVYATSGYEQSVTNLSQVSGYTAALTIGV